MVVKENDNIHSNTRPYLYDVGQGILLMSVDADLVYMSNGVVACSYGRNGSNLMFSLDKGKTWEYHRVITDESGYNYTAIREVSPGRLLYVHDAPHIQALYVDVELLE